MNHAEHLVVALAYDSLCTFEFGCTVEFFALERPELGVPWYRFEVCAYERSPIREMGGIRVVAPRSFRALDRADTIIIPGWRNVEELPRRHSCALCAAPTSEARGSARSAPASSFSPPPECSTGSA